MSETFYTAMGLTIMFISFISTLALIFYPEVDFVVNNISLPIVWSVAVVGTISLLISLCYEEVE